MIDIIIVVIVVVVLGLAAFYVYKAKKSGQKCIGCPHSATCGGICSGCSGNCSSYSEKK